MTAAAQRTPASLLLEMCNQNGWTPEYDLTSVVGASHDPTFTYRVKVGDVIATASGQSKKKAKHFAAKSALEQLLSSSDPTKNSFLFENITVTLGNLNEVIVEPSSEPVPMGNDARNEIGELQEQCMKHKKMAPYYETIDETGPPHDKMFSVQCQVEQYITFGDGKTKKIAKRVAAESMLKKLHQHDFFPPKVEEKESEAVEKKEENMTEITIDQNEAKPKLSDLFNIENSTSKSIQEIDCAVDKLKIGDCSD